MTFSPDDFDTSGVELVPKEGEEPTNPLDGYTAKEQAADAVLYGVENSAIKGERGPDSKKWVMEISQNTIGVEHPDDYDFEKLPVEVIDMKDLTGFEPDEKMESSQSASKVTDMAEAIKNNTYEEPPILVRRYGDGYQVVDGHHRFHAHRSADSLTIKVRVVPDEDIVYKDSR